MLCLLRRNNKWSSRLAAFAWYHDSQNSLLCTRLSKSKLSRYSSYIPLFLLHSRKSPLSSHLNISSASFHPNSHFHSPFLMPAFFPFNSSSKNDCSHTKILLQVSIYWCILLITSPNLKFTLNRIIILTAVPSY
jgi:hypothetical protein